MFNITTIKQVLTSILVGASIAFITTLLQGLLNYFGHFDPGSVGAGSGMVFHLLKWRINPTV